MLPATLRTMTYTVQILRSSSCSVAQRVPIKRTSIDWPIPLPQALLITVSNTSLRIDRYQSSHMAHPYSDAPQPLSIELRLRVQSPSNRVTDIVYLMFGANCCRSQSYMLGRINVFGQQSIGLFVSHGVCCTVRLCKR
jgi:hypothetical protein